MNAKQAVLIMRIEALSPENRERLNAALAFARLYEDTPDAQGLEDEDFAQWASGGLITWSTWTVEGGMEIPEMAVQFTRLRDCAYTQFDCVHPFSKKDITGKPRTDYWNIRANTNVASGQWIRWADSQYFSKEYT